MLSPACQQQRHLGYLDLGLRRHSFWTAAFIPLHQVFAAPWVINRPPSFSRPCGLPADLHDGARLSRPFIIGFHMGAGTTTFRLWYAGLFAKLRRTHQSSRIGYKAGNWPSSTSLHRETSAAMSYGWLDNYTQNIHKPLLKKAGVK